LLAALDRLYCTLFDFDFDNYGVEIIEMIEGHIHQYQSQ